MNILDTKIFPCDYSYQMQVIRYVFPNKPSLKVKTHELDGSISIESYKDIFSKYYGKIVIRLLHCTKNQIEMVDEMILDST